MPRVDRDVQNEEEEKAENVQKEKKWKSIKETNSKGKIKSKKKKAQQPIT
jgi:hypothetical protein